MKIICSDIQLPNLSLNFPTGDASTSAVNQLEGEVKAEKMEQMEGDPKNATVNPSTTSLEVPMEGTEMIKNDMEEAALKELVHEFLQEAAAAAQVLAPEAGLEGQGLQSWGDLEGFQANMLESEASQGTGATASTVDTSYFALYRQLLGRLPELHELIRRLGRKAGLRAAPKKVLAQREDLRAGAGVVRSPMMQAETSGITRSDGRLLLLPSELSLLAYANAQPLRSNAVGAKALHRLRRG